MHWDVRVANKNIIRDTYAVFEVEYLWNGWVKKDEVNANLILLNTNAITLETQLILPLVFLQIMPKVACYS